jgi:hypothetical protein
VLVIDDQLTTKATTDVATVAFEFPRQETTANHPVVGAVVNL